MIPRMASLVLLLLFAVWFIAKQALSLHVTRSCPFNKNSQFDAAIKPERWRTVIATSA